MVIDAKVMDPVPLLTGRSNYLEWEVTITSIFRDLDLWNKVGGIEVLNAEIEAMKLASGKAVTSTSQKDLMKQVELISILDVDDEMSTEQKQDILYNSDHKVDDVENQQKEQLHEETDEETKENAKLKEEFRRRIDQLGRQKLQQKEEIQAQRDAEASWLILRNIEPSIVAQIRTLSSAREMWKKLQFLYIGPDSIRRGHVYEQLARLCYGDCKNMLEYVHYFQELVAQLTQLGRPLSNFHAAHQLIAGLGMHYQAFQDRKRSLGDELEEQPLAGICAELVDEELKVDLEIRKSTFPFVVPTQEQQQQQPEHVMGEVIKEDQWVVRGTERPELPSMVHSPSRRPVDDAIADIVKEETDIDAVIESPISSFTVAAQDQKSNDEVKANVISPEEKTESNMEIERQPFSFNIPAQKEVQKQQKTQTQFQVLKDNVLDNQVRTVPKVSHGRKKKKTVEYCKYCQKYGHSDEICRNIPNKLRSRSKNSSSSSKRMETSASSSEVNFPYIAPKNPNRNWW